MDEKDRLLLTFLHQGLPLVSQPFRVFAASAGLDPAEVLVRIQRLKKEGVLSGISGAWNPRAFHYQSAWVAMRFEPEVYADRAEIVHRHPGVVYSCERAHELNFWFFVAVPVEYDLETHVRGLERFAAPLKSFFLPVRRVLKGADLLSAMDSGTFLEMNEHYEKRKSVCSSGLAAEEVELIRVLQGPFPMTDEPFQSIARQMNIPESRVLEIANGLVKKGCLRRIGSSVRPAPALERGFAAGSKNKTLLIWHVPEEKQERVREVIAGFPEVLYSDWRPAYPGFPYSLYMMVQAASHAAIDGIVRRVEEQIGQWPWDMLLTKRDLKKSPMRYFPKELEAWQQQNRSMAETAFITDQRPGT